MKPDGTVTGVAVASSPLREAWLNFFLNCAKEVAPQFKIGRPKMRYAPVQTENGRRNVVCVWDEEGGVKFSFNLWPNSPFENVLADARIEFKSEPRHLITFVSTSPGDETGSLLKPLAMQAAREALTNRIGMGTTRTR
jgi:hypothetical protein